MPAKSKAQFRLMQAVAHNPSIAKKTGISKSVGEEFVSATKAPKKLPERMKKGGKIKQRPMVPDYPGKELDDMAAEVGIVDYDNIPTYRKYDPVEMKTKPDFVNDSEDIYRMKNYDRTKKVDFEVKKGGGVNLSVGRGEKLPVSQGAGLTAKGRAKYNRETGSNLKAPQPEGGARKDSFCARMRPIAEKSEKGSRARASMKRWKC